jgi:Uma2 family endonuclease
LTATIGQTIMLQTRSQPLLPRLEPGDHLDQPTFHKRYQQMPESFRAELVEGVVFVPSPVSAEHGRPHALLAGWLTLYSSETPGTSVLDNATVILGQESEPQPDIALVIDEGCGGQTTLSSDGYCQGPPELVVEIAHSRAAYDLFEKRRDYERAGVREYVVVVVREQEVRWLERRGRRFHDVPKPRKGVYESRVFPGLRLDVAALMAADSKRLLDTLRTGLGSPEHAAFVAALRKRRRD